MRIAIETGHQNSRQFAQTVRALLEALVMQARVEVKQTGPLYRVNPRYENEPAGKDSFKTPLLVAHARKGDCAHFSLWRVAELRNAGIAATFDIWIQDPRDGTGRTFHVRVRLPDGSVEDPSIVLGMKVPRGLEIPQ